MKVKKQSFLQSFMLKVLKFSLDLKNLGFNSLTFKTSQVFCFDIESGLSNSRSNLSFFPLSMEKLTLKPNFSDASPSSSSSSSFNERLFSSFDFL